MTDTSRFRMSPQELADKYITEALNEFSELSPSSVGVMTVALVKACRDLEREQLISSFLLADFLNVDEQWALRSFREALTRSPTGAMHEKAVSALRILGNVVVHGDGRTEQEDPAPQAPDVAMAGPLGDEAPAGLDALYPEFCEHEWPAELHSEARCLNNCGLKYGQWSVEG